MFADLWASFQWCLFVFFAALGLIGWAIGKAGRTKATVAGVKIGGGLLWHLLSRR